MPPRFFDLGPRGIVVHDPKQAADRRYMYALEDQWRACEIANPSQGLQELVSGNRVPVTVLDGERVLVNLNAFVALDNGKSAPGVSTGRDGSESRAVLIFEGDKFFSAPTSPDDTIPEGFEQDAGVLVNRGAIVAAIPGGNIPVGTWCVLVNLAELIR